MRIPSLLLALGQRHSCQPAMMGSCQQAGAVQGLQHFHTSMQLCGQEDYRTAKGKRWKGTYGKTRMTPLQRLKSRTWYIYASMAKHTFKLPPGPSMAPSRAPYVTPPGWEDRAARAVTGQ